MAIIKPRKSFSGIAIAAPKKDIYGNIKEYEYQLISDKDALIEEKDGRGDISINIKHQAINQEYPLILTSWVDNNNRRHSFKMGSLTATDLVIGTRTFFRKFINKQKLISDFTLEPDMIGEIKIWPSTLMPDATWAICDGSAVSRTTYATLFAIIGTSYGAGDGSTTFNLPDFRGRVPVGRDALQTEFDSMGETGGAKTHTLTESQIPSHTHVQNSHTHTQSVANSSSLQTGGAWTGPGLGSAATGGTTATNQNTGGGGSHNNLQPYQVTNYIIKTS